MMADGKLHGSSRPERARPDRARKRAIRAHAEQAGIAYSIAARQLAAADLGPGETLASYGRTVYPVDLSSAGRWSIAARECRSPDERTWDAWLAGTLPSGRARHLVERFPPAVGRAGAAAGPLYDGPDRADLLALLYLVVAHESPELVPPAGELLWTAAIGEETALDTSCAHVDRAARHLLDGDRAEVWPRAEVALAAGRLARAISVRQDAERLTVASRAFGHLGDGLAGVRQILDALLVVAEDGHAPGTRVRLTPAHGRREATIVRAYWGAAGPPTGYELLPDGSAEARTARPEEIVVLPAQESEGAGVQV